MKAKSALSKNKLFSLLSYVGAVHHLPINFKRQVERALLKFLVPFLPSKDMSDIATTHKIVSLAAPSFLGGTLVDHITLHLDLLTLKTVMQYLKCRIQNIAIPDNLRFVEYNLWLQLCNLFKIPCIYKLHSSCP